MKLRVAIHLEEPASAACGVALSQAVTELGHVLVAWNDSDVTCLVSDQPRLESSALLWLRIEPKGGVPAALVRLRSLTELLAEATHTGASLESDNATLWLSDIRVDLVRGLVHRDGEVTKLSPIELAVLQRLAAVRGSFVDRQALERDVWGYKPGTDSRTVLSTVHRLRKKVERDTGAPKHLVSERARGYCLVVPESRLARVTEGTRVGREASAAGALAYCRDPVAS